MAFLGILLFAVPLTLVGANLPDFSQSWVNKWLYPWGTMVVVVALVMFWQKKKGA